MTFQYIFDVVRYMFNTFIHWLNSCTIFGLTLLQIISISVLLFVLIIIIKGFLKV